MCILVWKGEKRRNQTEATMLECTARARGKNQRLSLFDSTCAVACSLLGGSVMIIYLLHCTVTSS